MTVGYGSTTTAMAVNRDMTEGTINRFRTMGISRTAVLTGHVVGSSVRTLISAALVVGVALCLIFVTKRTESGASLRPLWTHFDD